MWAEVGFFSWDGGVAESAPLAYGLFAAERFYLSFLVGVGLGVDGFRVEHGAQLLFEILDQVCVNGNRGEVVALVGVVFQVE